MCFKEVKKWGKYIYGVFYISSHICYSQYFSFLPLHSNCHLMSLPFSLKKFLYYFLKGRAVITSTVRATGRGIPHCGNQVSPPRPQQHSCQSSRPVPPWQNAHSHGAKGDGSSPRRECFRQPLSLLRVQQFFKHKHFPDCHMPLVNFLSWNSCFLHSCLAP